MRATLAVVIAVVVFAGCAPITAVSGKLAIPEQGFEMQVPEGWYRVESIGRHQLTAAGVSFPALLMQRDDEGLLLTRDGLMLQAVRVERVRGDKGLQYTKRRVAAGMPVHDLAELELDNLRSNPEALNVEVLDNAPDTVAGRPGFRLAYTWKTRRGLRLKAVHYGVADGETLYRIVYQAAARYYFDKDAAAFEQVRQSFRLAGSKN